MPLVASALEEEVHDGARELAVLRVRSDRDHLDLFHPIGIDHRRIRRLTFRRGRRRAVQQHLIGIARGAQRRPQVDARTHPHELQAVALIGDGRRRLNQLGVDLGGRARGRHVDCGRASNDDHALGQGPHRQDEVDRERRAEQEAHLGSIDGSKPGELRAHTVHTRRQIREAVCAIRPGRRRLGAADEVRAGERDRHAGQQRSRGIDDGSGDARSRLRAGVVRRCDKARERPHSDRQRLMADG